MTRLSSDRIDDTMFSGILESIKRDGLKAERAVQRGFVAAWRDIANSHSVERLDRLWTVLADCKSPFKSQVSLAIRALAGMAAPVKNSQKWERTGKEPLQLGRAGWTLTLDDEGKAELKNRIAWGEVHFRSIQVAAAVSVFTWAEVNAFAERIRKANKRGTILSSDAAKLAELLAEIERIAAR